MNRDKAQLSTADLARAGKDETARGDLEEIDFRGQSDEQITARDTVIDRPATPATQQNIEPGRAQESSSPSRSTPPAKTASADVHGERTPLFAEKDAADLRKRWSDIQTGFVDEPRRAVEQADSLVAEAIPCAATIASNDVRLRTPSRCSIKRSIP